MEAIVLRDIGQANKAKITEAIAAEDDNPLDFADAFRLCHLEITLASERKLVMTMGSHEHRPTILKAMELLSFRKFTGVPPQGWMEEEASLWIDALGSG